MNVVIVGAGGHGRDLQAIVEAAGHRFVGFLDDYVDGPLVQGPVAERRSYGGVLFVGVNDPKVRRTLAQGLRGVSSEPLIHPTAVVGPGCTFGKGVVVAAGAILDRDVHLGDHVHVHTKASLTRTVVGDFTTVCPGATICGDVTVGAGVVVGAGAVVTNLRLIGDGAVIGAGAVVVSDVAPASTAVGVPARSAA